MQEGAGAPWDDAEQVGPDVQTAAAPRMETLEASEAWEGSEARKTTVHVRLYDTDCVC